MKVVLGNLKEYMVSIVTKTSNTEICIGFTGISKYDELVTDLTADSLQIVKYYQNDNSESFDVYEDYITFLKASVTTADDGTLDVAVYLEKANEVTILKEQVEILQDALDA